MHCAKWDDFWWGNITGPRTVVDRVLMALLENKMVILNVPSDLPWRLSMRGAIQSAFTERTEFRDIVIALIDAADKGAAAEPGRLILEQFAEPTVKTGYREKAGVSIQKYIASQNVIKNRIIWVTRVSEKTADSWLGFCRGFSPKTAADGLFVLEVHGKVPAPKSKRFEFIDFDKCVSSYDVQRYNSFILDEQGIHSNNWKRYISTVAAGVCGIDAEISERLLRVVDFHTESAVEGVKRIDETGDFDLRGTEEDSNHILRYYRSGGMKELLHRIWAAQVQVLFPIIEFERQQLVEKWSDNIRAALTGNEVYQYGEVLTEPAEAELGTLCFMMHSKTRENLRMLYVPDDADREKIRFLHACRNKLAHMSCCSPEEVAGLLD